MTHQIIQWIPQWVKENISIKIMDNRRDKDKEFDRAQAMDRLTQDDKDKISLIKMMLDKEKEEMHDDPGDIRIDHDYYTNEDKAIDKDDKKYHDKFQKKRLDKAIDYDEEFRDMKKENIDYRLDPYDDKEEVEGMIIKLIVGKRGVDADIAKSFIDTHYTDIINADGPDGILDEFDEFMSVNTEYVKEEDNVEVDVSDAAAGDDAIERESASGAFEEAINWRGETLKEQFKRLTK